MQIIESPRNRVVTELLRYGSVTVSIEGTAQHDQCNMRNTRCNRAFDRTLLVSLSWHYFASLEPRNAV